MAVLKSLLVAMIALLVLCVYAAAGEAKAPTAGAEPAPPAGAVELAAASAEPAPPAGAVERAAASGSDGTVSCEGGAVELAVAGGQMVAEVSGAITVRYSVTNKQEKKVTLVGAKPHKTYRPLVWQVTGATGEPILRTEPGLSGIVPDGDDFNDSVEGRFSGEATFRPPDGKWPADKVLVRATYAATLDMYKSEGVTAPENAFVGAVSASPIEFTIKPDGWKEATYKRYADELAEKLKTTLDPLAFEFPELRSINESTSTLTAEGAIGQFKLVREYLEVDDKAKTARLRRAEGFLEFAALDPWTAGRPEPDVRGTVEGGLVALEFRTQMKTNQHLLDRLYWIESDIVKECGGTVVHMGTKKPRPEIPPIPEPPKLTKPAAVEKPSAPPASEAVQPPAPPQP